MRLTFVLMGIVILSLIGCGGAERTRSSENQLQVIQDRNEIRIAVKANAAPFSLQVGDTFVGFEVDLAQALAAGLGVDKVTFKPVRSSERIGVIQNGSADLVIATMTITQGRDQDIDFSMPYFEDGQMLLVDKASSIAGYTDLTAKSVGAVTGSTSLQNLSQVAPDATVAAYADMKEAINDLKKGAIDAVTSDGLILLGLASADDDLRVVGERFSAEPYGIGMAENQSDLRDAVNVCLQNLWQTGQWQQMYDIWFGVGSGFESPIDFAIAPFQK